METLKSFNKYILDEYNMIENNEELSSPLLISSDKNYIEDLKRKIFYIGQETNCWFNYDFPNNQVCSEDLEQTYFKFLQNGARNRDFWKYYKQLLEISDEELIHNVIWNNTFISGKRQGIGAPSVNKQLSDLSLEYLLNIRRLLEPEAIILVNGPKNPYYEQTIRFLKELKSNLVDSYPTLQQPVVIDSKNNVFWTYHPAFQNRTHIKEKVMDKIKSNIL